MKKQENDGPNISLSAVFKSVSNFLSKIGRKKLLIIASTVSFILVICTVIVVMMTGNFAGISLSNINVKLISAQSGLSIPNADVKIESDNGAMCIAAGNCPTDSQTWKGKSDSNGEITIPTRLINQNTSISVTGYGGGIDLKNNSQKDGNNWSIELDPDSATKSYSIRIKVLDTKTQKPVQNTSVEITGGTNCTTKDCSSYYFKGMTNQLGNVYYPSSTASSKYWISVDGYKTKELQTTWANNKIEVAPAS